MKKINNVVLFLLVISLIFLTACTSNKDNGTSTETSTTAETTAVKESSEPEPAVPEKTIFKKFEEELTAKGYKFEKISMAAEMIGAKQGINYKFSAGSAEIYLFDESAEKYKEAQKSQSVYIDGFGAVEATVKSGAALIMTDLSKSEAKKVENIFNGII